MKLLFKNICIIALCVALAICFVSCERDLTTNSFDSVKDFKNAIKHNPSHYNGKSVSVKGTIAKTDSEILLGSSIYFFDISQVQIRDEVKNNTNISIIISDAMQLSVLETGDRVVICGTVTISDGEIYLDNCEYTMIETFEEIIERLE
jgi:hypothetical protein